MADKLHVDIVTVEGRRFKGDADFVVAPGSEGELGVLPRHIPLLTPLAAGSVKVRNGRYAGDDTFIVDLQESLKPGLYTFMAAVYLGGNFINPTVKTSTYRVEGAS